MRAWLFMILSITALVAVVVGVRKLRDGGDGGGGPVIPDPMILDTVGVWCGAQGELVVLVRPFYADPARDAFNRDRWNESLGLEGEPRAFLQVWLVNYGSEPAALPAPDSFRVIGHPNWRASGIDALLARARPPFAAVARAWAAGGREAVGPGELMRLAVAFPAVPDPHEPLEITGAGGPITLSPGRMRLADLMRLEKRPRGRIGALVIYDETARPPTESERAERDK